MSNTLDVVEETGNYFFDRVRFAHIFSFLCSVVWVFCFVFVLCSCVPGVSGLFIFDCPFDFLYHLCISADYIPMTISG
jgi:hypothetical protein